IADESTAVESPRRVDLSDRVPALTIVSHAVAQRAGEQCLLRRMAPGRPIQLSRNSPEFIPPGKILGAPLNDPFISRKPIEFSPGPGGGIHIGVPAGVKLVAGTVGGAVGGTVVDGGIDLTREDLAAGVPLEIADRVVR